MTTAAKILSKMPTPSFEATHRERAAFGLRTPQSLLEWTKQHVRVTEGPLIGSSRVPSPWSPDTYPLQRVLLDALDSSKWSRVILMTPPQAFGKTQSAAIPLLLYSLFYRGVSCFYVAADENVAKKQWTNKLEPAMRADPYLDHMFFVNTDLGGNWKERKFVNGTSLHFAGGNKPLVATTAPVLVFDDAHAYKHVLPDGRGHMVDDGAKRSHSYARDQVKHCVIGTATHHDGYLAKQMRESALFIPFVPCPECNTYQLLHHERLKYSKDSPEAAEETAYVACANRECERHITFDDLPAMLRAHVWASCPPGEDWISGDSSHVTLDLDDANIYPNSERTTNVAGFWANSLYWPLGLTWGQRAAYLLEIEGDPEKLRDHQINDEVIPYKAPDIDEERLTPEEVETHIVEGYPAWHVPTEADIVTCTVDVQLGYIYYVVRAWRKSDGTSWLVGMKTLGRPVKSMDLEDPTRRDYAGAVGISNALDKLNELVRAGFPAINPDGEVGKNIDIQFGLIDRGYMPDTISKWVRIRGGGKWHMIRGDSGSRNASMWPAKLSKDKNHMPYRSCDVNQAKLLLRNCLRIIRGQPGYWHMPSEGIADRTLRAYINQVTAERYNTNRPRPKWETEVQGAANHFGDCEAYQIIAAFAAGVALPGMPKRTAPKVKRVTRPIVNKRRKLSRDY